ncbi:hypothetical protein ZWY2020_017830 [Hordeum vulgare]|nr:hypothetical protein ZWY2020_017830 [Hordeum vulgare]
MADAPPPASSSDPPPPAGPDEPLSLGYLSLRQAGPASEEEEASPAPAGPPGDRCRAMMEVVRKDSVAGAGAVGEEGKWKVSKLVAEHNHGLDAAPAGEAAAAPALGMEFDSVHDAKGFYYGYGERAGFKARTGSNRRSAGTGAMIMQRFLCCRGNYSYRKGNKARDSDAAKEVAEGAAGEGEGEGEGKAGAHKKRGRKPGKKSTPVIELENSVEKGVARAAAGNGQAVPSTKNLGRGGDKKDVAEKDVESVVELEEEHDEVEDATRDGAHDLGDGDGANSDADEDEMEKEVKVKEKRGRGRPRKAVTEGNALQACASTDLGVTASQCAIDERKKILHKYLSKRQSRPSSGRPAKIVSRQALAERRKRGDGGRFLASDGPLPSERRSKRLEKQNLQNEKKPESKEDEIVEAEQDPETEVVAGPGGEPKVDPKFMVSKRHNSLYRTLYKVAAKAAENIEGQRFMESQYDQLLEQVEILLQAKLHDKPSLSTIMRSQQPNLLQNDTSNSEPRRASSKKNKNVENRRRQQSPLESSKKKKGRQGLVEPEEAELPLGVLAPTISNDIPNHMSTPTNQFLAPSHLMQAPYVTQQFGLNSLQGFSGMSPFGQMQEQSPVHLQQPHLQQPPFHSGPQMHQAPPPDIQSLQFLSSNPQLGHQTTDQGQYTIPVWDFL